MKLQNALAFHGNADALNTVMVKLMDDGLIDDLVESLDLIDEATLETKLLFKVHLPEDAWVNIFEVHERLGLDVDVISASTDNATFVDIVSISGEHDAHVNDSTEHCNDMCQEYHLGEFLEEDTGYGYDDDEDDEYSEDY